MEQDLEGSKCHNEKDGGVKEEETLEDLNLSTDSIVDDKDNHVECKEDCLQEEKEIVGEEKSEDPINEESPLDLTVNVKQSHGETETREDSMVNEKQCHGETETREKDDIIFNRSIIQLITTRPFQDSEDETETENISISTIDDPKQRILWAAEKNEVDIVRQLLEEEMTLVNARDEDQYTPLHRACSNNHMEIVKLLLSSGADLGARTEDGWYPLHCACRWDSVEAASLLLQNGANVNATSKGGLSPLHLAAANSSGRRTLELLLWHPYIDGSLKAENGDTAYDIARRTSNTLLRLFELLEESGNRF